MEPRHFSETGALLSESGGACDRDRAPHCRCRKRRGAGHSDLGSVGAGPCCP